MAAGPERQEPTFEERAGTSDTEVLVAGHSRRQAKGKDIEQLVEADSGESTSSGHPRRQRSLHLFDFHALPEHLQDNEYIQSGYRVNLSVKQMLLSIFRIHNETGNIWTHLVGFLVFLSLTIYAAVHAPSVVGIPNFQPSGYLPALASIPGLPSFPALKNMSMAVLPEALSSCFVPQGAKLPDACVLNTVSEDIRKLVRPYLGASQDSYPVTRWPFFLFLGGAMVCLLTSSICHLVGCQSKQLNNLIWRFDYAGIAILIATSFYPPIFYGFMCDPIPRNIYLAAITLLGVLAVAVSLLDKFQTPEFRPFRAALFVAMGWSAVVPCSHKLLFDFADPVIRKTTFLMLLMAVFYCLGAVFYATRIPERWLPGKFDLAGHSHQIFHLFVIAGALTHHYTGLLFLDWREHTGCSAGGLGGNAFASDSLAWGY